MPLTKQHRTYWLTASTSLLRTVRHHTVKSKNKMKGFNDLAEFCKEIRTKIIKADLEGAFATLQKMIDLIDDSNYAIQKDQLEFRYNKYKKEVHNGTVSQEEGNRQLNDIIVSLLQFLQNLDVQLTLKENHDKIDNIQESISQISARLSLNIEIAKERITRLGECWTAMYIFENQLFSVVKDFLESLLENAELSAELDDKILAFKYNRNLDNLYNILSDSEIMSILENCSLSSDEHGILLQNMEIAFEEYSKADLVLERNKFWLGFKIYEQARKYHDCYPIFLSEYRDKKYTGCLTCLSYQKDAKGSIENAIKIFQNKFFETEE